MNGWTVSLILFFGVVNFACYYHVLIPASLRQDVKFLKDVKTITVKTWCLYGQTPGFSLPACILMEYTFI